MIEILVMGGMGLGMWIFSRMILKEPILPWKEKKASEYVGKSPKKEKEKKHKVQLDQEPNFFEELFDNVKDISHHMLRYKDNTFVLIAEVEPVNYFLKSQNEQEAVDITFERWLAQLNYPVQVYLQNRFIDLSEPIENMKKNMKEAEDLNEHARSYGQSMIEDLINWQLVSPRYETKRYLSFSFQVKAYEITADDKDELEEKIIDKAFAELMRRMNTAKSQLKKADINIQLLTTDGIIDLLYHTFNRRKAIKNRFKDFEAQEMTALYVTADQDAARIDAVKEMGISETAAEEKQAG